MRRHPINFTPLEWRPDPIVDPRRSVLLTSALAVLLCVTALSMQVEPVPAVDAAETVEVAPVVRATEVRIAADDQAAVELWRAQEYLPWQQFLDDMPGYLGDGTQLASVTYNAQTRTLDISGEIREVAQLPAIMLRLDETPWLCDPNPLVVELNDVTRHARFTLQLRVLPLLSLAKDHD